MQEYFDTVKSSKWSFKNAFHYFSEEHPDFTNEQLVSGFHRGLQAAKSQCAKNWIASWNDLVKNINEPKKPNRKTRSAAPPLSVDMRNSTNNIAIGGDIHAVPKRQRDDNGEGPSTKRAAREEKEGEQEEEEEEDNKEDPRSDLSHDYHPARTSTYVLEEKVDDGDDDEEEDDEWMVGGYSISKALEGFRDMSMKIPPSDMSDLRLLAINNIYLFTLARDESVLRYFDVYSEDDEYGENAELLCDEIQDVLHNDDGDIELSTNIFIWADKLSNASTTVTNWMKIQGITIGFLNTAFENNNKDELIAANILHKLALNFCNRSPNMSLEDSFAHNIVSSIFEAVFQSDALLSHQWANGYLHGSDKYKPDYIVFISHSQDRYDLAISEIKAPTNKGSNNVTESDQLKTGKEMQWMTNSLIRRGVNDPVVCAVMLKGYTMYTYKMDLAYPHIYRMIELSSITICNNLQGAVTLPAILRNMLQVKNIVKKTAVQAKIRATAKSMGIAPTYSPPLSYISSSNYHLRRVSSSDKKKK